MCARHLILPLFVLFTPALFPAGVFLEAGSIYQNTQSLFGSGDTASVNGKYFAANASLGYESRTWYAGVSTPFASRTTNAEYYYASTDQKVSGMVSESGMGDPSFWGAKDIFGGNRYAPAVSITGAASVPVGKTALSLQTWQARPGLAFEYPVAFVSLTLRTYAAIPFAPKAAVEGQYSSYAGALLSAGMYVFRNLYSGIDVSYAAGDFVRSDASLRVGGFMNLRLPLDNLSLYVGGQSEVVRSDRDFFAMMSVRYQNIKF